MLARLADWINARWPVKAVAEWSFREEIPGGASFFYTLGSSLLFVFILQAVTGAWELLYYVPSADHAYQSLSYLRTQVPFGWLMHNLHYWGNNAFVVLIALHVARVFTWGAFKAPRQLIWLTGALLLLLTAGITFTGAVLGWDELGYWAAEVGNSILGTIPLVGGFARRVAQGGDVMGPMTLSRFFVFHALIFAALIALFIGIHLVAFRQFGSVGPWDPERAKRKGWFWPDQIVIDLLVASLIFVVLVGLAAFVPPPETGPADPQDFSYTPRPEWNFLFLYQALKVFRGPWEPVGTVLLPLVLVALLFLVPFLDRRPERAPRRRVAAIGLASGLAAAIIALTIIGDVTGPPTFVGPAAGGAPAAPTARAAAATLSPSAQAGERLVLAQGCLACHMLDGKGGTVGPDLSGEGDRGRSREWLTVQIRDPKAHNPNTIMPASVSLSDQQVGALVSFLETLHAKPRPPSAPPPGVTVPAGRARLPASGKQGPPGPAADMIGSAPHGAVLYLQTCKACHGPEGMDKVPNPGSADGTVPPLKPLDPALYSRDPVVFAGNIDRFLQHGSVPEGPHPALDMPAFGDTSTLSQPQLANIEAYVLSLNGVNRAQILNPGIAPWLFFTITAGTFALLWMALAVWWFRNRGAGRGPLQ
jgi:ubiquinol-cytochrome c reductase cytochrome b subunit